MAPPAVALLADDDGPGELATAGGFSLHAGIAARADQRDKVRSHSDREGALGYKLERLCRYVARPAVADSRLSLTRQGQVRYSLKTPWRDGTTHVLFEPLDFAALAHPCARGISASDLQGCRKCNGIVGTIPAVHVIARLAALIPRPGVNLTRYDLHGCNECRVRRDAHKRPRGFRTCMPSGATVACARRSRRHGAVSGRPVMGRPLHLRSAAP